MRQLKEWSVLTVRMQGNDLTSLCRDVHGFLEKESIKSVAMHKNLFNLQFIKQFASNFPNSDIQFIVIITM